MNEVRVIIDVQW